MPELNGYEMLKQIKTLNPDILSMIISANVDEKF